ncbi:hypothetical protein DRO97_00860 [Archaeoglobales archaeon]|nr:MAG: hypothetical protein DRO97_00860 [Archaeoglobales archaeon]
MRLVELSVDDLILLLIDGLADVIDVSGEVVRLYIPPTELDKYVNIRKVLYSKRNGIVTIHKSYIGGKAIVIPIPKEMINSESESE